MSERFRLAFDQEQTTQRDALAYAMWEANFNGDLSERMMTVHGEATDSSYREAAEMILLSLPPGRRLLDTLP